MCLPIVAPNRRPEDNVVAITLERRVMTSDPEALAKPLQVSRHVPLE